MSFISNLLSGGASKLIDSVGDALDGVITSKEEKLQLELEERKAEREYELENKRLDLEETKTYLQDTSSARDMNSQVQNSENASWLAKNITPILAAITVFLTFILFYVFAFKKIDVESKDIVIYILGAMSTILMQIFGFYFGSSQGSKNNSKRVDDLIKKM